MIPTGSCETWLGVGPCPQLTVPHAGGPRVAQRGPGVRSQDGPWAGRREQLSSFVPGGSTFSTREATGSWGLGCSWRVLGLAGFVLLGLDIVFHSQSSTYCLQKIEQILIQCGRLICNTKYLINTVKFHFMGTCICAVISRS